MRQVPVSSTPKRLKNISSDSKKSREEMGYGESPKPENFELDER